jgi:hypothetical protein
VAWEASEASRMQTRPRAVWWQHSHTAISLPRCPETLSRIPYQHPTMSSSPHLGSAYLTEQLPALLSSAHAHKGCRGTTSNPLPGCSPGRHAAYQTSPLTTSQPPKSSHSIDNPLVSLAGRRTLKHSLCVRASVHVFPKQLTWGRGSLIVE